MSIRVVIQDHTHSKKTTVELPEEVTMQRLLPALAQRMQLPLQQGGNPVIYRLDSRRTGRRLDDEDTLRSAGVEPDELLTLLPEVTAGAAAEDKIVIGATVQVTPQRRKPAWRARGHQRAHGPVVIRLHEKAFEALHDAAAATLDEVGGLLIGEVAEWKGVLYVDVRAALAGKSTRAGPAHFTFTVDTWAELLRRKEQELPEGWIVGWYHSHPRVGIFLSELDLALHRHFFPQPWHVALVVNAQDEEFGFFCHERGSIRAMRAFAWARTNRKRWRLWISLAAAGVALAVWQRRSRQP